MDKIKIKNLEIKFYFFYTLQKITVGGFVNQLIKKFWHKQHCVVHTGDKPYSCPKCRGCLNPKFSMNRHLISFQSML